MHHVRLAMTLLTLLGAALATHATDTYEVSRVLQVPSPAIGSATFSDVVLTVNLPQVRGPAYNVAVTARHLASIEGLLPETVCTAVFSRCPDLVMAATAGTKEEKESARKQIKGRLYAQFKVSARPGDKFFGDFYKAVRIINRALRDNASQSMPSRGRQDFHGRA